MTAERQHHGPFGGSKTRVFLVVVAAAYVVLAAIWWTGVGAIHARIIVTHSVPLGDSGQRAATIKIINTAPTPLRVESVDIVDGRFLDPKIERATIGGRATADLRITYSADCELGAPFPNAPVVLVHVKTVLGLERKTYQDSANALKC